MQKIKQFIKDYPIITVAGMIVCIFIVVRIVSFLFIGDCSPEMYKINIDPKIITSVNVPANIKSVIQFPHEEVFHPGVSLGDEKESIYHHDKNGGYEFILYDSKGSALKAFSSITDMKKSFSGTIYEEGGDKYNNYYIEYCNPAHSDPESLCMPYDYCNAKAIFVKNNLLVEYSWTVNKNGASFEKAINSYDFNKSLEEVASLLNGLNK